MKRPKNNSYLRTLRHGMFFSLFIEMLEMWFLLVAFRVLAHLMYTIIRLFPIDGGPFKVLNFITDTHIVIGFIMLCAFYAYRNMSRFRKR